jgi:hypothetical protein
LENGEIIFQKIFEYLKEKDFENSILNQNNKLWIACFKDDGLKCVLNYKWIFFLN